jgi:L-amino acid N-acyltransferase
MPLYWRKAFTRAIHEGTPMTIRDAQLSDLPAIADIMNHYRMHTTHIWDRRLIGADALLKWLSAHAAPPYCALVAEEGERILGYASLSRFRPHSGYNPTAEDSIYLAPGYEGHGNGCALMQALFERAKQNGLRVITAWIDSRNTPSVRFHEKMGFTHVGIMRNVGCIDGAPSSVIIMQTDLLT